MKSKRMKLSHLSSTPYRPRVIKISKTELRSIGHIKNIDSRPALITELPHLSSGTRITAIGKKYPSLTRHDRTSKPQRDLRLFCPDTNLKTQTGPVRKASRVLLTSSRRRITPIPEQESAGSIDQAKNIDSQTAPPNTNATYSLPIVNDHPNLLDKQYQGNKKRKRRGLPVPMWLWLWCLICVVLVLAAIATILIALLLSKQSVSTSSTIKSTTSTSTASSSSVTTSTTTSTTTTEPYCTTLITFDDIPNESATSGVILNGYKYLNWNNTFYLSASTLPMSGYQTAVYSPPYVAYNPGGAMLQITSANGTSFAFNSAIVSAAWRNNLMLTVYGYRYGVNTLTGSILITEVNQTTVTCGGCTNYDTLQFTASGGTLISGLAQNGTEFGFDNLCSSFGY